MTYEELSNKAKEGKTGRLPNFIGYFNWSYRYNELMFHNGDFRCKAKDLNVQNRTDFYYIT